MATFLKHVSKKLICNNKLSLINLDKIPSRCYGVKRHFKQKVNKVVMPEHRKLKSIEDSVAARGFLRCQRDYTPPVDVEQKLALLYKNIVGDIKTILSSDLNKRCQLLAVCSQEFNHSIPNSILHTIQSYDDLLNYYNTEVNTTLPLEKFKEADLPPNLHIQYEPLRFHPDDDTKFNGETAFPKTNTLVTGLRTKKKFKGYKAVEGWPVF